MFIQFEFAFSGIEIANHTFLPDSTFQDVHTYIFNHPKIQHNQLVQVQLFDNHDLKKPLSSCSKLPTTISVLRITNPRAPELRAQLQKDPTLLLKHIMDVDTTKLLLQLKADPNTKDKDANIPLHWASSNGHMDAARLLLQANADPNTKDKYGTTSIHWACRFGRVDTARLLLQSNADPNTKDKHGNTPLIEASIYGRVDTARLLLQSNADPNTKNNSGKTPLHLTSNPEIKQLLESSMQIE